MLTKQFLIRSAGDLCWDLHVGQQESVLMAASSRGLSLLGHGGLLDSARAQCHEKGWWHSQLGKSRVCAWKRG